MNKEVFRSFLKYGKRTIGVLGVICLAVTIILCIAYGFSDKAYIVIQKPAAGHYAAFSAVSAPARFDQTGAVSFVPFALDLREGDTAFIQSGVRKNGLQRNSDLSFSYDKSVVSVENKKDGAFITALAAGQTMLEAVIDGDPLPVCLVTVK